VGIENSTATWLAPNDSPFVENVACPLPLRVTAEPTGELFTKNCTWPAGTAVDGALAKTVAVKVTVWPLVEGFAEDVSVVSVDARSTVREDSAEVLDRKEGELGVYEAAMPYGDSPTPNVFVVNVATPLPFSITVPSPVNCTEPVGTLSDGGDVVTVAVKVICWP